MNQENIDGEFSGVILMVWDMKNGKHVTLRKYMKYDSWIWKKGLDINWELIGD